MMKSALYALAASSLLGSALSLNPRHMHLHKKGVDQAYPPLEHKCCKTVVTVTVYEDDAEPTTTITTTRTHLNVVTVSAVPTEPAAPAAPSAPAAPQQPPPAPPSGIVTNGNKWAMTYTPYTQNGDCKAAPDVLTDLTLIKSKGFTTVRMYGTDCDGLNSVGTAAKTVGLKLILGIFIKGDGIEAARPQIGQIASWGQQDNNWGNVVLIVVGNEAIHQGFCDGGSLAQFIADAKAGFKAAGSGSIPVTTTEVVNTFVQNAGALCPVIDVVGVNVESFFDGKVVAANAGSFVQDQLKMAEDACTGKPASYVLESGWPSGGGDNGASVASPEAQGAAIGDISAKMGGKTVLFSFGDDYWKPAGTEQHFGCIQHF